MTLLDRILSPAAVQAVGWTLLHSLWQGAVAALLLAVALGVLRRRSASARYLAGCAALLLMVAAPLATLTVLCRAGAPESGSRPIPAASASTVSPATPMPVVPALPRPEQSSLPVPPLQAPTARLAATASHTPWSARVSAQLDTALPWIVLGWLAGVLVLSVRLLSGWLQLARLKRSGTRAAGDSREESLTRIARRLRVTRPVRLLESALAQVPTAIGWLRPVILLPVSAVTGLTPRQVEAVLAHELAHIRRYDYLVNLFQTVVETLLFYHPAVWWISRRIRVEREHCCDDLAVAACGDAAVYARALAELEGLRSVPARLAVAAGGAALLPRIRRLLALPDPRSNRSGAWVVGILVVAALVGVGSHAWRARAAAGQSAAGTKDAAQKQAETMPTRYRPVPAEWRDLTPTRNIRGVVQGEDDKPVGDETVLALAGPVDEPGERRTTTANNAGEFEFTNLSDGWWSFSVDDVRFGVMWPHTTSLGIPVDPLELPVRVKLYTARKFEATIVDAVGQPVPDVTVKLAREFLPDGHMPQGWLAWTVQVTRTDPNGVFRFDRLNPGRAMFVLEKEGFARTLSDDIDVSAKGVRIAMDPGLTLRGAVMRDGERAANATVHVGSVNFAHLNMGTWDIQTDAHGEFEASGIANLTRYEYRDWIVNVCVDDFEAAARWYQIYKQADGTLPFVTVDAARRRSRDEPPQIVVVGEAKHPGRPELAGQPTGDCTVVVHLAPSLREQLPRGTRVGIYQVDQQGTAVSRNEVVDKDFTARFSGPPAGRYRVDLGHAAPFVAPQAAEVPEHGMAEITLGPGPATLRGVVRSGGQPVAQADVRITGPEQSPSVGWVGSYPQKTDATGAYEFAGIGAFTYEIEVTAPDSIVFHATSDPGLTLSDGVTTFNVNLPEGGIDGRVVNLQPFPNTPVSVRPAGRNAQASNGLVPDAEGRFRIDYLAPGDYRLTIGGQPLPGSATVHVPEHGRATATLSPPTDTGLIAGKLATAGPIDLSQFGTLTIFAQRQDEQSQGRLDWQTGRGRINAATGTYCIPGLEPATYAVYVLVSPGSRPESWTPANVAFEQIEVRTDQVAELDIGVPKGRMIRFKCEAADDLLSLPCMLRPTGGAPIPGAVLGIWSLRNLIGWAPFALAPGEYSIELRQKSGETLSMPFKVEAGDGEQLVELGTPWRARAAGGGQVNSNAQDQTAALYKPIPADTGPTSTITGVVVDEASQPVADAPVRALRLVEGEEDNGSRREARTGPDGRFRFDELKPAGFWVFSVDDVRFAREWEREHGRAVPADELDLPLKIQLYRPRTLEGVVVNEAGAPLPVTTVTLAREFLPGHDDPVQGWLAWDLQVTTSDVNGSFKLTRLRPGRVILVLDHEGYARTLSGLIEVSGRPVQVTIEKGLTLRGRVVADGKPLSSVGVTINAVNLAHRSMGNWQIKTDGDGGFAVEHVSARVADDLRMGPAPIATVSVEDPAWYSPVYHVQQSEVGKLPFVQLQATPGAIDPMKREVVRVGETTGGSEPERMGQPIGDSAIAVRFEGEIKDAAGQFRRIRIVRIIEDAQQWVSREEELSAAGTVVFEKLPAGTYQLSTETYRNPIYPPQKVAVADGQRLEVVMKKGPADLSGVLRSGNEPLRATKGSVSCDGFVADACYRFFGSISEDGTYELDGLEPGSYELCIFLSRSFPCYVDVDVAAPTTRLDIELPQGSIVGKVVGGVAGLDEFTRHVSVTPRDDLASAGRSSIGWPVAADGSFAVQHVPPGEYILVAPWSGASGLEWRGTARVDTSGSQVDVELRPPERTGWIGGTLTGVVRTPGIRNYFSIGAFPKDQAGYVLSSGYSGKLDQAISRYRLSGLPAGTYGVLFGCYASSNVPMETPFVWIPDVQVREEFVRTLDIAVPPGRAVRIKLDYVGKRPFRAVWRLRLPSGDWFPFSNFIGSSGVGLVTPGGLVTLPYGEYVVEADFGRGVKATRSFRVEPGEGVLDVVVPMP